MPKKRLDVNWKREIGKEDIKPALKRYRRYLEDNGLRASTIPMYVSHASKYLEFIGTDSPCADDFARFRDHLHDRKLSRSTINDYSFSIKSITKCSDKSVTFTFIKPNNPIPYYFDEQEITKIFGLCGNPSWILVSVLPKMASLHPTIILPAAVTGILDCPQAFLCSLYLPKNRIGIHILISPKTLFCSLNRNFCRNIGIVPIYGWIIYGVIRIQISNLLSLAVRECIGELLSCSRSD